MTLELSPEAQELARKASLQGLTGKTKLNWDKNSVPQELYGYDIAPEHTALYEQVKKDLVRIAVLSFVRCTN